MSLHTKTKCVLSVCVLLLTVLLLLPHGTSAAAATQLSSAPVLSSTPVADRLNYANPDSEATVELTASAFLSLLTREAISEAEAAYVDSVLVENPFTYSEAIPPRAVDTVYEHNTLTITARPHSYTAANGETVTWIPTAATLGLKRIQLLPVGEEGEMQGTLQDVAESDDARLKVTYSCTLTVPAAVSDDYLNYAWNYADKLYGEQESYKAHLAAWEAYCTYLTDKAAYDLALGEWQAYVTAKEKYDKKLAEYVTYEQELALYREQLAAYEAYCSALDYYKQRLDAYETAYMTYTAQLKAYNAALVQYETEQAQLAEAVDCMQTLESVYIFNSRGKQMYATLIGDTVATVVNRKDELVDVGKCDPKDIDTADASTAVLQKLLTEYKEIEDPAARFAFYEKHYADISRNFSLLYGSLRSLYNNTNVKKVLIEYNKLERYIEFLSQLYVVSSGLDDSTNRADDWKIFGRYDPAYMGNRPHSYKTELEPAQIPDDKNNADPAGKTYPSPLSAKPLAPAPLMMTPPTPPAEVSHPIEPDAVIKPTEPTPVAEPTPPTAVNDPGGKPVAPSYTLLQRQLIAAYTSGSLRRRETGADISISLPNTTLQKRLSLQNKRPIEFFDADGKTLLYFTEQDDGTPITFVGDTPSRPDTDKYTYRFVGWKDQDGQLLADLGVVDEMHECFYASYEATVRQYTVTWRVDGEDTAVSLPYGAIPAYEGVPTRASTAQYSYTFVGWRIPGTDEWSTDLTAVVGDVTYEAAFEADTRRYTVTWIYSPIEGDSSAAEWEWGTLPSPVKTPVHPEDDTYLYTFTGWDSEPAPVTGHVTYTAQYDALPILPPADNDAENLQSPVCENDVYLATVPTSGLQIDRLLTLADAKEREISLASTDGCLSLYANAAAIADLRASGCFYVYIDTSTPPSRAVQAPYYSIRFADAQGQDIALRCPITLQFVNATTFTKVYNRNPADDEGVETALPFSYADGVLSVKLNQSTVLQFRDECAITVLPCDNGVLSVDRTIAAVGDTVTLTLTCADGYRAESLHIIGAVTGTDYAAGNSLGQTFIMPDEPVTVSATLLRMTFTVIFTVDGQVVSEKVYFKGDNVEIPADPTKAQEGRAVYTFTGWSPIVTTVVGDATYTAVFRESVQGDSNDYIPPDSRNREYLLYIELGILLLIIISIPVATVLLIRHAVKKRKLRKAALSSKADSSHTNHSS